MEFILDRLLDPIRSLVLIGCKIVGLCMYRTSFISNIIALFGSAGYNDANSLLTASVLSILNLLYFAVYCRSSDYVEGQRAALVLSMISISVSLSAMLRFADPMDWILPSAAMIWTSWVIPFTDWFRKMYEESLHKSSSCLEWTCWTFMCFLMGILVGVPTFVGWGLFIILYPFALYCWPEGVKYVISDKIKGGLMWILFVWVIVNAAVHTLWSRIFLSVLCVSVLIEFGMVILVKGRSLGEYAESRV